jgi:hypothetical protein
MVALPSGLTFSRRLIPPGRQQGVNVVGQIRDVDFYFVSFDMSAGGLSVGGAINSSSPGIISQVSSDGELRLPPGVTRQTLHGVRPDEEMRYILRSGDARLLAIVTRPTGIGGAEAPLTDRLPLLVTPAQGSGTLDARMKVIAPTGGGDYTATIDVYAEPWGTHPDGHYGSWSVVVPGDGQAHDYAFRFDPPARAVTTERDGQPVQTFAWNGPPTQGDFRAWLVLTDSKGLVARVPLYAFALDGGRVTGVQIEPESLEVVPVGEAGR